MMSQQFTCDNCSCQFKSKRSLAWHLTCYQECKVHASSLLFKCPYCKTTFHHKKGFALHLNSQHSGKTESSIILNSESSPSNNDNDRQTNSQFDFCGDADKSVCTSSVSNNNNPHLNPYRREET